MEPLDASRTRSHSRPRIMMRIKPLAPLCHKEAPPRCATRLRAYTAAPAICTFPQPSGYATGYATAGFAAIRCHTLPYAASRS